MADIAFVSDQTIFGGGESNLLRLATAMSDAHRTTVVAPAGPLLERARAAGLPTVVLPDGFTRWIKGVPLHLGRGLADLARGFDLVHAYSLHVLPALFGHPRLIWTVHGPWERPWGLRARVTARHVRRVVAVSCDVAGRCAFPDGLVVTIPLGAIDERECAVVSTVVPRSTDRTLRIGVLGRLQPIKGQDLAVRAVARLAERVPGLPIRLELAGAADETNAADRAFAAAVHDEADRAATARHGLAVTWSGFITDTDAFYARQDLVLVPSRYESFSMVTVEALARGLPVVVPDCGGPAEIVNEGSIGLRFVPGDVDAMAARLYDAVVGHPFDRARAIQRARDFTVERQRDRHLRVYDEVLP